MRGVFGGLAPGGRRGSDLMELCRQATDKHLPGPYPEYNAEVRPSEVARTY